MTLRQKYNQLHDAAFVEKMVVASVYHTMQLEGQAVPKEKVAKLYRQVKKEAALKSLQRG